MMAGAWTKRQLQKILSRETPDQKELKNKIREQGGIGVKNVRDRLELFFHKNDIMEIEGEPNGGCKNIDAFAKPDCGVMTCIKFDDSG